MGPGLEAEAAAEAEAVELEATACGGRQLKRSAGRVSKRHKPFAGPDRMSLFGTGPLADGSGWGLFGRAGRSWDSVPVVGAAQIVDAMALSPSCSGFLARGVEGKQRCNRDGTGVAAPPGSAQDCGCCRLGDSSLWLWPRMTDSGCQSGGLAGWMACVGRAQVFPRLRGAGALWRERGCRKSVGCQKAGVAPNGQA